MNHEVEIHTHQEANEKNTYDVKHKMALELINGITRFQEPLMELTILIKWFCKN